MTHPTYDAEYRAAYRDASEVERALKVQSMVLAVRSAIVDCMVECKILFPWRISVPGGWVRVEFEPHAEP